MAGTTPTLTKLTKNQYIPFLDTAKDATFAASTWKRIDLSTIFELTINEKEESMDYICYENPVTEITGNEPELPQEIACYQGDPIYDFVFGELFSLPVGSACKIPFLICFGGTEKKAWRGICTLTSKVLNTVDGKITFSLKMGGDIGKGTYVITDGSPTFTAATT